MFISLLENDSEFRTILLLEQTAIRRSGGVTAGKEFRDLVALIDDIVKAMKDSGELEAKVDIQALRSALIGAIEGMMRDQLMAVSDFPSKYSVEQVRLTLATLVDSVCDFQRPLTRLERLATDTAAALPTEDDWIRYYLKLADRALAPTDLS